MDKPELLIINVLPGLGQLNAMLKNIMAQMDIDDPNEAIRCINAGEWVVKMSNLLKRVTTMAVNGTKKFVASEHLKEANVGLTGSNFDKLFLGKVEENVGDATIAVDRLEKASPDAPIMAELGGRAEIQLAHFFGPLKAQSRGEAGVLLVNGCANVAYIRGTDGDVWAVGAYWDSDYGCWYVGAYSVGDPRGWIAGFQVLSRDS